VYVAVPFPSVLVVTSLVMLPRLGSGARESETSTDCLGVTITLRLEVSVPCAKTTFGEQAPCDLAQLAFGATRNPLTVRSIVVCPVNPPDVPVMVTFALPFAAAALAVSVNTLLLVAGFGLNAAVTPLGKPDAESETLPLKGLPFAAVMVIALVPLVPAKTFNVGDAESVKGVAAQLPEHVQVPGALL